MDKVQKHNSFNTITPSSESYRKKVPLISLEDGTAVRVKTASGLGGGGGHLISYSEI
jgi:hypothetical protein